ncbi:MAG: hypothetical protein IKK82_12710 [Kiritimatiellae bacterium]|nr:hypothetical protein [Kiritimatiellia bacterium]
MMTTSITSSRSQFDSKRISDGARWHRRYVNGFGETVREEWPGFGELAQRRRDAEYDSKGRLVRVEETSKPIETRAYDYFGEVTNITYAVDDEWRRIATDTSNALIDGEIWRVSSRMVFCSDPSIAPLIGTALDANGVFRLFYNFDARTENFADNSEFYSAPVWKRFGGHL